MWLLSYKIFGPYTLLIHELSDLEQKRFGQKMLKKVSFCPSLSANNLETTLNLILKIYVRLNKVDIILQVHVCRFSSFRDKKKINLVKFGMYTTFEIHGTELANLP